jgi:DNA-binding IscR family transcriptional regulator
MSLELHLDLLFESERNKKIAYDFLNYIKKRSREGNPYKGTEWKEYCEQNKIPVPTFYQVVRKLRKFGLIVKEGGHHDGVYRLGSTEALYKKLSDEWIKFISE